MNYVIFFLNTFLGHFTKTTPKNKVNLPLCKQFQREEFICKKKNSVHHGTLMTQC